MIQANKAIKLEQGKKVSDGLLVGASLLIALLCNFLNPGLDLMEAFVIGYFIFTTLRFINTLGHTINIFDFLTFYSALDTLFAPLLTYKFFGRDNPLSSLWGAFMRVPEDDYFSFLIPANLALFIGLHLVYRKNARYALPYLERAKAYLSNKMRVGLIFIVVGLAAGIVGPYAPDALSYIFTLLSMLPYVGGFYVYFSARKRRTLIMTSLIVIFFLQAIHSGLFGVFVMYIVLSMSLIMAEYKLRFISKLSVFLLGLMVILVIQSAKGEYRAVTWWGRGIDDKYKGESSTEIFLDIASDKIANPDELFGDKALFFLNRRFNQGWLISLTMNYVPRVEPFANGETIWTSLEAVVVPRLLWPDKPESGGAANLARFVGIKKRLHYSMNIGPYGEGYGNFGPAGGVVFIFFYSTLIGFFLHKTLEKSKKYPSLIVWVPMLFYSVLTVETDILSTINAFVKSVVFVYLVYLVAQKAFKTSI